MKLISSIFVVRENFVYSCIFELNWFNCLKIKLMTQTFHSEMMKEEVSGDKFIFSFTSNNIELFDELQHLWFGV